MVLRQGMMLMLVVVQEQDKMDILEHQHHQIQLDKVVMERLPFRTLSEPEFERK